MTEYQSTGILCLRVEGNRKKEWKDGKEKLEDQFANILAKLELQGKQV